MKLTNEEIVKMAHVLKDIAGELYGAVAKEAKKNVFNEFVKKFNITDEDAKENNIVFVLEIARGETQEAFNLKRVSHG